LNKVIGVTSLIVPVLLAFVLLSLLLPKIDPNFDTSSWKLYTSPSYLMDYITGYARGGGTNVYRPARRLEQIIFANTITTNKWFGSGIGILSYSDLLGIGPSNTFLAQSLIWSTGLTRHLLETGIIGTFLYILLLLSFFPICVKLLKRSATDRKGRIFLTCFSATVVIFTLTGIYNDSWKFRATACVFWLSAAIVWKQYHCNPKS